MDYDTGENALSIKERRSVLFASLLRYAPEVSSLRNRALESIVRACLFGSSETNPYHLSDIRENLQEGLNGTDLRQELIREAIDRQIEQKTVIKTEHQHRDAYFLAPSAQESLENQGRDTERLFAGAISRAFQNTESFVSASTVKHIFLDFLADCFARFGKRIAKTVTGHAKASELPQLSEAVRAAKQACARHDLNSSNTESLTTRCLDFLRSEHPDDERLRLHLTQGYYISELLGIDDAAFAPLVQDAFQGAVFFLDTNIVIPRILQSDETDLFDELVRIAGRLGVRLVVTRATINEARRVANDRRESLSTITKRIPKELTSRSRDQFLRAFLRERESTPSLTADEFLEPFDDIMGIIGKSGVVLEDKIEDDLVPAELPAREYKILNDAALETRGFGKSDQVARHDLFHHLLVETERPENSRTWFLTSDRTLLLAAAKLCSDAPSTFFSFPGLLQSISPFITTAEEETLSRYFSAALREEIQAFPAGPVFDLDELKLISEYHEDILCTPPEQLIKAFDFVKKEVLQGNPYRQSDHPKVTLELRKLLASNTDEERKALLAETRRSKEDAKVAEELAYAEAESKQQLQNELEQLKSTVGEQNRQLEALQEKAHREQQAKRAVLALAGIIAAGLLWYFDDALAGLLTSKLGLPTLSHIQQIIGLAGLLVWAAPSIWFVRGTTWGNQAQAGVVTAVLLVGLVFSRLASQEVLKEWSAPLSLVGVVATIIVFWKRR